MRVHVIGCCGSFAGPEGAASSYLLEHEDEAGRTWRVLMDLGSGAFGIIVDSVADVQEIGGDNRFKIISATGARRAAAPKGASRLRRR